MTLVEKVPCRESILSRKCLVGKVSCREKSLVEKVSCRENYLIEKVYVKQMSVENRLVEQMTQLQTKRLHKNQF